MKNEKALLRRLVRYETRSSRALAAALVAGVSALVMAAVVAAGVWLTVDASAAGRLRGWAGPLAGSQAVWLAVGAISLLLGAVLIWLALAPGRRARRGVVKDRFALVVDDGLLAEASAAMVSSQCGLSRGHVRVDVGRRKVRVTLTPVTGVPVDRERAGQAAMVPFEDAGIHVRPDVVVRAKGTLA